MFQADPAKLVTQFQSGNASMGNVTDETSVARFGIIGQRYVLIYIKGLWTGGTGSATLTLKLDHHSKLTHFDFTEATWLTMGTDNNDTLNFRVPSDEYVRWTYMPGDILVPTWANPNTQRWSLEVGLQAVDDG